MSAVHTFYPSIDLSSPSSIPGKYSPISMTHLPSDILPHPLLLCDHYCIERSGSSLGGIPSSSWTSLFVAGPNSCLWDMAQAPAAFDPSIDLSSVSRLRDLRRAMQNAARSIANPTTAPATIPIMTLMLILCGDGFAVLLSVPSPVIVIDAVACNSVVDTIDIELTDLDDASSKTCFNVTTPMLVEQQSVEFPQHHRSLVAVPSQDMTSVMPDGHISMHFPPCQSSSVQ